MVFNVKNLIHTPKECFLGKWADMSQALGRFSLSVMATQTSLCTQCVLTISIMHSLGLLGEVIKWQTGLSPVYWVDLLICNGKKICNGDPKWMSAWKDTEALGFLTIASKLGRHLRVKEKANSFLLEYSAMSRIVVILTLWWRPTTVAAEIASAN